MEFLINELSLDGQFESNNEFAESIRDFIRIIKIAEEQSIIISKKFDLYSRKVTANESLSDLFRTRGTKENDHYRRMKSILLKNSYNPPFWEVNQLHKSTNKYENNLLGNLVGSSIAEACERDKAIISFNHHLFKDKIISVNKNDTLISIYNATYQQCFLNYIFNDVSVINIEKFCTYKYENTRLCCDKLEDEYGFSQLEKHEREMVIETFDRMVNKNNWNEVYVDPSLHYKEYSPSSKKDDWFANKKYDNLKIDKFRCGNTKVASLRCFGYRDGEVFHVLRFERDHRISDKG